MSAISTDISRGNVMSNSVEARNRIFGRTFGRTTFRPDLVSEDNNQMKSSLRSVNDFENMPERTLNTTLQKRISQALITNNEVSKLEGIRPLGLQSRIAEEPLHLQEDNLRFSKIMDETHCKSHISTVSRTFGLISEDLNGLNSQNNGRLNQELRKSNIYSSVMQRPFGLFEHDSRVNQSSNATSLGSYLKMPAMSKASDNVIDNEGFTHHLERNGNINSSLMSKRFGLQSKNLMPYSGLFPEGRFGLNQGSNYRSHNLSMIPKPFGSTAGNSTLITELQVQDRMRYNDHSNDDGVFRRPTLSRVIRGRNSTLSSRLLHDQRHCKDLSNISSVNVSYIPRREGDTLSESRLALNTRSNWMDNQSIASSFMSVTSIKSQFMSVFESLHSSILNIGPRITAEAVRVEIERAKQKLEIINERSFALSVKDTGETSVISQPSKYICPSVNEPSVLNTIDGGSLHLKSSKDLLQTLISGIDQFESLAHSEKGNKRKTRSSFEIKKPEDEDASPGVFKKPKPLNNKGLRSNKVKVTQAAKKLASKATGKVINLQQWYPIAIGHDLALCGVNEEGSVVKTEAIKKRLNNRKIELRNGVNCNLIGSPATMISELPKKIIALMENGLTERWRVLQKELLSCQIAEKEKKKFFSRSSSEKNSPEKKKRVSGSREVKCSPEKKKILGSPKAKNLPEKKKRVSGSREVKCSPEKKKILESPKAKNSPEKKKRVSGSREVKCSPEKKKILESPKAKNSPEKKKRVSGSREVKCSPEKKKILGSPKAKNSPEKKKRVSGGREVKCSPEKKKILGSPKAKNSPEKKKRVSGGREVKCSPEKKKILGSPKAKNLPEKKKRVSGSPEVKCSPKMKKRILGSPKAKSSSKMKKKILGSPKAKSSPGGRNRISVSPKASNSPEKKKRFSRTLKELETSLEKKNKNISKKKPNIRSIEVISTPKKGTVSEVQTRSGRTVKPPSMFWLIASGNNEMISVESPKNRKEEMEGKEIKVHLHTEDDTKWPDRAPQAQSNRKRKRKMAGDWDSVQSKKSKVEKKTKVEVEVRVEVGEQGMKKGKKIRSKPSTARSPKPVKSPYVQKEGKTVKNKTVKSTSKTKKKTEEMLGSEEDFEFSLDDIHVPEVARLSENPRLSRSQLRLAAMETPPLKYFNNNLKLLRSATPVQSPDWYISQRTESEARKFQKRREEAFKKTKTDVKKTVIQKTKNVYSKDLKRMMEWVAEKTVRSPQWNSQVLQYVIPSRKQIELEDEDEDVEMEFL